MNRRHFAALVVAGALATAPLGGQVFPSLGPEIVLNETILGPQTFTGVAFGEIGRYLTLWTALDRDLHLQVTGRFVDTTGNLLGGEFPISSGSVDVEQPSIASGGDVFAVAWLSDGVQLRRFDRFGQPLGTAVRIDTAGLEVQSVDVAVNAAGDTLVAWSTVGRHILVRQVSRAGVLGNVVEAATSGDLGFAGVRVAAAPDGGFLILWELNIPLFPGALEARRINAGGTLGSFIEVTETVDVGGLNDDARPLFRPDGSFSILWRNGPSGITFPVLRAKSWSAAGTPLTDEVKLDFNFVGPFAAALDPAGNTLVLTADSIFGVHGRLFDRAWHAVTADIVFSPPLPVVQSEASVAIDVVGNALAVWTLEGTAVLARPLAASPCDVGVLCLGSNGRFLVRAEWTNPNNGESGIGHSVPLTADTGAFWFFGDQNLELMVKVLDGTSINGRFWVYGGALSNVEYTLTVSDTLTGTVRTYHNPAGQIASLADVQAFPAAAGAAGTTGTAGTVKTDKTATAGPLPVAGHFTVEVQFTDPRTGFAGAATPVPLTSDTGAFWFFDAANLELMVKVLDGRAVNGKFWVFYGALSDVDYTLTVTDTESGLFKTYHNPRGTLASHADTAAF